MVLNKRGISPVVATVLLISLAIMLAMIVLLWARGFFTEQIEKNGKNIENVCKEAKIEVLYDNTLGANNNLKMRVKNTGSIIIGAVEIREEGREIKTRSQNVSLNPGMVSGEINYVISDIANLKQIKVYPSLLGTVKGKNANKFAACLTNSEVIKKDRLII